MTAPRFLQVHTLHSYAAALLNRDDSGLAKRIRFGGVSRTRISSQCLKRHWRTADDPHALQNLAGFVNSVRSRELVTEKVIAPLRGQFAEEVVNALEPEFQKLVYGEKADKGKKSRQTLLLGQPELDWLAREAKRLADGAKDKKAAEKAVAEWVKDKNFKAMSENSALPGGLAAALFGRMVTSDPAANIDAPVHVAHAFTVHAEEVEDDYFTAVDDLKRDDDDSGADTIQETEITCGLFYGYAVIDIPGLVANCGGDRSLAGRRCPQPDVFDRRGVARRQARLDSALRSRRIHASGSGRPAAAQPRGGLPQARRARTRRRRREARRPARSLRPCVRDGRNAHMPQPLGRQARRNADWIARGPRDLGRGAG